MTTKIYIMPDDFIQVVCANEQRPDCKLGRSNSIATGKGRYDEQTNTAWFELMGKKFPLPIVGPVEVHHVA